MEKRECLMPPMKKAIKTAIETNLDCTEGLIDRIKSELEKTEDEFIKKSLQGTINIYKFHIGWLKGLKDEVEKIPECEK